MFDQKKLSRAQLTQRYIWLSIAAAVLGITLKLTAWYVSGSVSLFSDAMESFVNLGSALFALFMLRIAHEPPDETHPFGHTKAEYFSSGFEGTMIFLAATLILYAAIPRLFDPQPLEALGIGIWFSLASTAVNFVVAMILGRAGVKLNSIALGADSRHLMTDVWTTIGVILGLGAVLLTNWLWLDALIAIGVALHILFEGYKLMKEAVNGLMDKAMAPEDVEKIELILKSYEEQEVRYTNLRTRQAASKHFILVNIIVPDDWGVKSAHEVVDEIEDKIRAALSDTIITTHMEPHSIHRIEV